MGNDHPEREQLLAGLLARLESRQADIDELCRQHPSIDTELRRGWELLQQSAISDSPPPSTASASLARMRTDADGLDGERFELLDEVGRGGMGVVREVRDHRLRRTIAVKALHDDAGYGDERVAERLLEEAQITGQLTHPGVVPLHDLTLDANGRPCFTMQLVDGETAADVFRSSARGEDDWTLTKAVEVLLKVCDTMAFAHDKGVVHRDLKPTNVMVGRYGQVYVMDWGLARTRGDAGDGALAPVVTDRRDAAVAEPESPLRTRDGAVLGTLCYMHCGASPPGNAEAPLTSTASAPNSAR